MTAAGYTNDGNRSSDFTLCNDFRRANVGNFANQVSGNARQQANQHIHLSESKKTLAEAAEQMQQLLKQLEQTNPTATELHKKLQPQGDGVFSH
ncbi:MAG: hypothetical protein ACYTX0_40640 [Nostoc sp.]